MNPTTEDRLWQEIRSENLTAYTAMITGHMGLVHRLAWDAKRPDLRDDLQGEGEVALCVGVGQYVEKEPRCRFSTSYIPASAPRR